jgi:sec-independent protein translocase protein TatA
MSPLFAIFSVTPMEMIVLLVIGVLLFGRRLPEVGRYLGKGIVEFKKGIHGLEDNLDVNHPAAPPRQEQQVEQIRPPQRVPATAPKFEDAPQNITPPPRV